MLRCLLQITLGSGDALVFGGGARRILHSVPKIHAADASSSAMISALAANERAWLEAATAGLSHGANSRDSELQFRINLNFREK